MLSDTRFGLDPYVKLDNRISKYHDDMVLKNRNLILNRIRCGFNFVRAEPLIAQDFMLSWIYITCVLRSAWPPGEQAISSNPDIAYMYAKDFLKGRFELGEETIIKSHVITTQYVKNVLRIMPYDNNFGFDEEYRMCKNANEYFSKLIRRNVKRDNLMQRALACVDRIKDKFK